MYGFPYGDRTLPDEDGYYDDYGFWRSYDDDYDDDEDDDDEDDEDDEE